MLGRISQFGSTRHDSTTDFKLALSLLNMKEPTQAQLPQMQQVFQKLIEDTDFEILLHTTDIMAKRLLAKGIVTPETIMFGMSEVEADLPAGRAEILRLHAMNEIVKAGRQSNIVSRVVFDGLDVTLGADLYNFPRHSEIFVSLLNPKHRQSGYSDDRNVWAILGEWIADPSAASHGEAMKVSIQMLSNAKSTAVEVANGHRIRVPRTAPVFFVRGIRAYAQHPNHDPAIIAQIRKLEKKWGPILEEQIKEIGPRVRSRWTLGG